MTLKHSIRWGSAAALALFAFPPLCHAADMPVAIVAPFANMSRDRHTILGTAATDAVASELKKRNIYEVITSRELDRAMANRGLSFPLSDDDLAALAKDLSANLVVTGEVRFVDARSKGGQREVEAGLLVRVRDAAGGELVNGAAERAVVTVPAGGVKTDAELAVDALGLAALHAASRIEEYQPITGTIMNSGGIGNGSGIGAMMLNRGSSHGVKPHQEFIVYRGGVRVGRVRAEKLSASYTELAVLDNSGIQPQDRALSIFPEPK